MPTILIAGGTGLVGQRLSRLLLEKNYRVMHLSRRADPAAEFATYAWDVEKKIIAQEAVDQADVIINLAGTGIADGRWTEAQRKAIISSRVESTLLLKSAIEKRTNPLQAYLSASAVGYYGSRGDALMHETDPPGTEGFLPEVTVQWEKAAEKVATIGVRTVLVRIGVVLSTRGGALEKIILPFKFFTGTYFGDGQQWMSWVHLDDLCRIFIHAIENEKMSGVYNGVAPHPARNRELTTAVKTALDKPAVLVPAPEPVMRLAMGEMADVVFDSTRVSAAKILKTDFHFQFPELLPALRDLLRRKI